MIIVITQRALWIYLGGMFAVFVYYALRTVFGKKCSDKTIQHNMEMFGKRGWLSWASFAMILFVYLLSFLGWLIEKVKNKNK